MPRWNLAAVEKAAPDAGSLAAARKLARPGPWSETGSSDTLVWGKCQGSGKTPYQVSIDLMAAAIDRRDLSQWAAGHDIVTAHQVRDD